MNVEETTINMEDILEKTDMKTVGTKRLLEVCDARVLHLRESTGTGYVPISVSGTYPYLNL
jgi:hypothetical protein